MTSDLSSPNHSKGYWSSFNAYHSNRDYAWHVQLRFPAPKASYVVSITIPTYYSDNFSS